MITLGEFLFHHKNIHSEYSLEAPGCDTSNGYLQHIFLWRN